MLEAHSLAHLPRLSEGANLATAWQTKTAPPRTGHRPCPASAAQLMRPKDGQGCGDDRRGAKGGDKFECGTKRASAKEAQAGNAKKKKR